MIRLLAISLGVGLLTQAPSTVRAQVRVAVLALRAAPPGTVAPGVLKPASDLIWRRLAAVPGVAAVHESSIAQVVGTTYPALAACARDDCMAQLGAYGRVQRTVWGWVQPLPAGGFQVELRVLGPAGTLMARSALPCPGCSGATLLAGIAAWDLRVLRFEAWVRPAAPTLRGEGALHVSSRPKGAQVAVNGYVVGITPLREVRLPAGEHTVVVWLPGHVPARRSVRIDPGQTTAVGLKLERASPP